MSARLRNPRSDGPPVTASHRRHLTVDDYVSGVRAGDRATVARAITLVESRKAEHRALAQDMLVRLLPHAGAAHRVGIPGVPGVGKSTFIEALGPHLPCQGHKAAVPAVDPTSGRTRGQNLVPQPRHTALGPAAPHLPRPATP